MPATQMERVIQTLRHATLPHDGAGLTDGQLLERYLSSREEAAFAALLNRHGPMIWGVCRRILSRHQDAEDAFQATFLVLVCKAACITPREKVANWLYGVAHQTAVRVRATAARRRMREKQVTVMPEPTTNEPRGKGGLEALLDEELSRLPEKYREVIVLCDLEGKTRKEAAQHFHLPEGTVATRLATARTMLARRLSRLGVSVTGGALAALLAQRAASAHVPATVASTTIKAASLFAAGQAAAGGVLSATAVAVTKGVLKTMLLNKLKVTTSVLLFLAVLGSGMVTLTGQALTEKQAQKPAKQKKAPADQPVKEKKEPVKEEKPREPAPREVHGPVKAVDAEKNTFTVAHKEGDKTYTVAMGAEVWIDGKLGKLAELPPGPQVYVSVILADDRTTALKVQASGQQFGFVTVKSVDAEKNTITFEEDKQPAEIAGKTLPLRKGAGIVIDGKPGKLADVPPGTVVNLTLCVDQKTICVFFAEGRSFWTVAVKSVDAEKNTITFKDDKQLPAELSGKTFPVARDADIRIDGKAGILAGVPGGAFVYLRLSVDQKTARSVWAEGPWLPSGSALIKSVDSEKSTITFDDDRQPEEVSGKTFDVMKTGDIRIDGKAAKLADVPAGAYARLHLSADQNMAVALWVEGPTVNFMRVKSVDLDKGTITFEEEVERPDYVSGKTLPVAKDAQIMFDREPGKLDRILKGATVNQMILSVDKKTVRRMFLSNN
jgi:RNA polymerase sigma factor (sigma-70 family)